MPALRDTLSCIFNWTLASGGEAINVLHARLQGGGTPTTSDCEALATLLEDWWSNNDFEGETNTRMRDWISIHCVLDTITVRDAGAGPTVQAVALIGDAGQVSGDPMPNDSAFVTTLTTATPGRSGRGRTFWPQTGVSLVQDNGTWEDAFVAAFGNTVHALGAGLISEGTFELCVLSRKAGTPTYGVTNVIPRDTPYRQRRRRPS